MLAAMPVGLERIGRDPKGGRPYFLFDGADLSAWDVPTSGFDLFAAFLALNGDRYSDEEITALGERLRVAGLAYLCAWGPECSRVHDLFDLVFIEEEQRGVQGPFLMTTWHDDEPLAEGLWYAIDLAIPEDVKDVRESPVVIGTDRDDWRREIRTRLADVEELRRHVVEDLPN